jgi:FAD:protein FMN transferase
MKTKISFLVFCLVLVLQPVYSQSNLTLYSFEHQQMGTIFRIKIYTKDSLQASKAARKAFLKLDTLNFILSDYRSDSEINSLISNASKSFVTVSEDLWNILEISQQAYHKSNGAFDVSLGLLTKLWRRSYRQGILPDSVQLQDAKSRSGFDKVLLDNHQVKFSKENMQLDFGGIGKGYALDKMMEILKKDSFQYVLIETGSSVLCSDFPFENQGWPIVINGKSIELQNKATSSSGATFQNIRINKQIYGHIIDPKTGLGINHLKEISLIGDSAAEADWQSTAMCVMTKKELRQFAKKYKIRFYKKSDTGK